MKKLLILSLIALIPFLAFSKEPKVKSPKKEYLITITTQFGDIKLILYDETPLHKANMIKLINEGFYNGTTFHRIIDGFMIQGGDPNSKDTDPVNDGMGGPAYTIPAEFNPKFTHNQGAVAAARMGDGGNPLKASNGSQFYIVEGKDGAGFLNGSYTVFGKVIKGIEIVEKIAEQQKDGRDRPYEDIKMAVKVELLRKKKITKLYAYTF